MKFSQIQIGSTFTVPGQNQVYTKLSEQEAQGANNSQTSHFEPGEKVGFARGTLLKSISEQ